MNIPMVIEKSAGYEKAYDIYSRLLKDRIIFIGDQITDPLSNLIVAQILFLESESPHEDIALYVNSPGGIITAGLAIYDTMNFISCDVSTICIGQAASMAAVLLTAGTKGKRFVLPNSKVMIHQPLGGAEGQITDLEIATKEGLRVKKRINQILSKHTQQPIEKIEKDTDRNYYMHAQEAVEYGIVDQIISKREKKD